MDLRSCREDASRTLSHAAYDPKKLAALHIGVITLAALALALINYLLSKGMESTGGLSGMGLRAGLGTAQYMLGAANTLLLPFWEIGFLFAALAFARQTAVRPGSLLEGFRRFGPVLRLYFLEALIFLGLAVAGIQIATMIFMATPLSSGLQAQLQVLAEQPSLEITNELVVSLLPHIVPVYVIFGVLYALVAIPIFYRFRLAVFAIMDDTPRARASLAVSARITKSHRWELFLVDLSFWWYYAAQIAIAAVAYGVELLDLIGVSLPGDPNVGVLACYLVSLGLQFFLIRAFAPYVQTTYAHCYDRLRAAAPSPENSSEPTPR